MHIDLIEYETSYYVLCCYYHCFCNWPTCSIINSRNDLMIPRACLRQSPDEINTPSFKRLYKSGCRQLSFFSLLHPSLSLSNLTVRTRLNEFLDIFIHFWPPCPSLSGMAKSKSRWRCLEIFGEGWR